MNSAKKRKKNMTALLDPEKSRVAKEEWKVGTQKTPIRGNMRIGGGSEDAPHNIRKEPRRREEWVSSRSRA